MTERGIKRCNELMRHKAKGAIGLLFILAIGARYVPKIGDLVSVRLWLTNSAISLGHLALENSANR
jgi:hypothetical protein